MTGVRVVQIASALALSFPVCAQDDGPDMDFLEYLGSWDDEDEAWYVEVQIAESDDEDSDADESVPKELRAEREDD